MEKQRERHLIENITELLKELHEISDEYFGTTAQSWRNGKITTYRKEEVKTTDDK
jgi:hypothetical protein